jgi:prepilin-type N-terminal cleavage/methylation domain-containing protein
MSARLVSKGFTLVEILIVIAIIAILASTILSNLGNARQNGEDARIKQQVTAVKSQAEIVFGSSNSFLSVCTDTVALWSAFPGSACFSQADNWIVTTQLVSASTTYWCADSTGFSGARAAGPATAVGQTCE